jgi:hypothetical protein
MGQRLQVQLVAVATVLLACSSSTTPDYCVTMEEACRQINSNRKAVLCNTVEQVKALSPLAPMVYISHYKQEEDPVDAHLYPSTFKIRNAVPSDSLGTLVALPKCNNSIKDGYLILERAPNQTTIQPNAPKVTKLADHVMPTSYYTDSGTVKSQDPAFNYIAEGAQLFRKCVDEGLQDAEGHWELEGLEGAEFALEWATLMASQPCNDIAKEYFQKISTHLEENPQDADHGDRANIILRLVTIHWGHPSVVANLMLLFGCNPEDSFDEFLSCTIILGNMWVDINVFQRNVDTKGDPWQCQTCSLHSVSRASFSGLSCLPCDKRIVGDFTTNHQAARLCRSSNCVTFPPPHDKFSINVGMHLALLQEVLLTHCFGQTVHISWMKRKCPLIRNLTRIWHPHPMAPHC